VNSHLIFQQDGVIVEVIKRLQTFPMLRGTTILIKTQGLLQELAQALPHLERLTLAAAPWNPRRNTARQNLVPSPECLVILASFEALTHLDSAASLAIDPESPLTSPAPSAEPLRSLLSSLAVVLPRLRYAGVDLVRSQAHGLPRHAWYKIARDDLGRFAGSTEMRDLRDVRFHDWEDVFRQMGIH